MYHKNRIISKIIKDYRNHDSSKLTAARIAWLIIIGTTLIKSPETSHGLREGSRDFCEINTRRLRRRGRGRRRRAQPVRECTRASSLMRWSHNSREMRDSGRVQGYDWYEPVGAAARSIGRERTRASAPASGNSLFSREKCVRGTRADVLFSNETHNQGTRTRD